MRTATAITAKSMDTYGNELARILEKKRLSMSELSRQTGVSITQIANLVKERSLPSEDSFTKIADALVLDDPTRKRWMLWIGQHRTDPFSQAYIEDLKAKLGRASGSENIALVRGGVPVPIFNIIAENEIEFEGNHPVGFTADHISVPGLSDENAFGCVIHDDSMEPRFKEGEIVIFAPNIPVESGDFAFVRTDKMATFKQIFFDDDYVRLCPVNRGYPEERILKKQLVAAYPYYATLRLNPRLKKSPERKRA